MFSCPPKPMLAGDCHEGSCQFPVLVQPKLDGFRCLARREVAGWVLYSRRGNVLDLPHITAALSVSSNVGLVLDGELYYHGIGFQSLTSKIRQASPLVEFHVFDFFSEVPVAWKMQGDRRQRGLALFHLGEGPIKRVPYQIATQQRDVDDAFVAAIGAGYEGIVLRDPDAHYEHGRSWALQKLKPHADAEFIVEECGLTPETNVPVLTLRNDLNRGVFKVVFPGLTDEPEECLGRLLTCRFAGRTDSLLPRHPVAMRFRSELAIEPPGINP